MESPGLEGAGSEVTVARLSPACSCARTSSPHCTGGWSEPPAPPGPLRARGTPVPGGERGAPASRRGAAAPGGSAGVRAAGWQRGAGELGGAAGRRGGPPGAARQPEGGCCRGPGLRDGNGAQAAHGAGDQRPRPQPCSAVGQGTPTPQQPPPPLQDRDQARGTGSLHPQHPVGSCTLLPAPTLAVPGGPSPPSSPFTAASVVPGAGAGGAEVQRGWGAGVGAEAVAVTVTVTAEGLQRAGGGSWEVLCREQRAGCHGASLAPWGPEHPKGDLQSVTLQGGSRNSSLGGAAPREPRAAGQWGRRLWRVPRACWGAGEASPPPPATSYLCRASGCCRVGEESGRGRPAGQHPVAPGACVGRGGGGSMLARDHTGPQP